jgi:hypothetical protein
MGDIQQPENEQNWDKLARAKGYKCEVCGQFIPFSERTLYFEQKMCSHCAHQMHKD